MPGTYVHTYIGMEQGIIKERRKHPNLFLFQTYPKEWIGMGFEPVRAYRKLS